MNRMPRTSRLRYFQKYWFRRLRSFMKNKVNQTYLRRVSSFFNDFFFNRIRCFTFASERWQSGRMRRSWKPLTVTGPGVRIPLSPPDKIKTHEFSWVFCFPNERSLLLRVWRTKKPAAKPPGFWSKYVASPKRDHEIILLSGEQKNLRRSRLGFDRSM